MDYIDFKPGIIIVGSVGIGKSSVVETCSKVLNNLRDKEIKE